MAWPYLFVFLGALLFDVVPFPFLPAFTVMIFLQVRYGLPVWPVLFIGVAGSILGRYASQNLGSLRAGLLSWESILGLLASGLLLGALLFIDWRSLIQQRRFVLDFKIFA